MVFGSFDQLSQNWLTDCFLSGKTCFSPHLQTDRPIGTFSQMFVFLKFLDKMELAKTDTCHKLYLYIYKVLDLVCWSPIWTRIIKSKRTVSRFELDC